MKNFFILGIIISSVFLQKLFGQNIKLTPYVIASQGNTFQNSDFEISWTLGELAAVTTISNPSKDLMLTQGFHQTDKYSVFIGINDPQSKMITRIFPNPASNYLQLHLQTEISDRLTIELMDISGRLIANISEITYAAVAKQIEIPVSGLSQGTYLCRISSKQKNQQNTLRFTKINN